MKGYFDEIPNLSFITKEEFVQRINIYFYILNGIDNLFLSEILDRKNEKCQLVQHRELCCAVPLDDLKNYHHILTPTKRCVGTIQNEKVKLIYRGVELADSDIEQVNIIKEKFNLEGKRVFGRTGSVNWIKYNKEEILGALRVLINDMGFIYFLVGNCESEMDLILQYYANNGINTENIIFSGRYNRENVQNYLACIDYYLYAPKAESFGYVILEAMLSKTPVFVPDVGSISETVSDKVNGFIIDFENSPGEKIMEIINNQKMVDDVIDNAQKFAKQRHSFRKYKESILSIFQCPQVV